MTPLSPLDSLSQDCFLYFVSSHHLHSTANILGLCGTPKLNSKSIRVLICRFLRSCHSNLKFGVKGARSSLRPPPKSYSHLLRHPFDLIIMHITIRNLTTEPISARTYPAPSKFALHRHAEEGVSLGNQLILPPSLDVTTILPKGFKRELILQRPKESHVSPVSQPTSPMTEKKPLLEAEVGEEWHIHPEGLKIQFSMSISATWQVVPVPAGCPWRVFTRRVRCCVASI